MENYMKSIGLNYADADKEAEEGDSPDRAENIKKSLTLNKSVGEESGNNIKLSFRANRRKGKSSLYNEKYHQIRDKYPPLPGI